MNIPKRVLIFGGTGMLGHKLVQLFKDRFETWTTVRSPFSRLERYGIYTPERTVTGIDADNVDSIVAAFGKIRPDVVINCVGIIKQLAEAHDPVVSLKINSLLPHRLAELCRVCGARLIHISTDCVFNGKKGNYTEDDFSDAEDLYGKTKFLGEVSGPGALTLRTSIIGREMSSSKSLIDWFLSNRGKTIRGFSRAVYTGFTTNAFAKIIGDVIESQPDLHGLYQVSADPINKYELLKLADQIYGTGITIEEDGDFFCDRSLDSAKFRNRCGFVPPGWPEMIEEMAADPTPYEDWHAR